MTLLATATELEPDGSADPTTHRIPYAATEITPEACEAAARVLRSGWVTTGPEVVEFERELAAWVGSAYGVAVASCTAAIEISLAALRLPEGAKVLTPTMTFCGAVQAIAHAGLRPVLCDCDPVSLLATPDLVAAAVHRAGGVDAMVVLHYAGFPAPVNELAEAAQLPLERVIEDAAHAIGAELGGRPVGTISAATCFSFYATKNLPIGEGGMITTDDPALADYAQRARLHGMSKDAWGRYLPGAGGGRSWRYSVEIPGIKANLTDLQAAIGRAQLRQLSRWQERREVLAYQYDRLLAKVVGVRTPPWPTEGRHAWHLYPLEIEASFGLTRDELADRLFERGIGTSVHFIPVHHHPHFQRLLDPPVRGFPGADAAADRVLSLPLHPGLSHTDVSTVCRVIGEVQEEAHAKAARHVRLGSGAGGGRNGLRALIVGAGEAGRAMARDLLAAPDYGLTPVGFLDDGPLGPEVQDVPVLGRIDDLREVIGRHLCDVVVIAIPSLGSAEIRRLTGDALTCGVTVRFLPSFVAALERDVRLDDLRRVRLDLLLGRDETPVIRATSGAAVKGKRVLVTGAGGSIGSELCRQICRFEPGVVSLVDHDESNLHMHQLDVEGAALLDDDQLIIADIRDRRRVEQLFEALRPQIVFHAAAHKHLPLLERHLCEAVKTNVLGTQHVADAALAVGTEAFINISTDKAADPVSVLGATKLLAELLVAERTAGATRFASVRFGNVLGSRGSFLAVLAEQIGRGMPVTVTHPDVTRFFMTVEEAAGLVLEAASMAGSGTSFVLDMGQPVRIVDLVRNYAAQLHLGPDDVQIRYTGLRPGEKLAEALFSEREARCPTSHPRIWSTRLRAPGTGFAEGLERLYAAAEINQPDVVRAILTELLPEYSPATAAPAGDLVAVAASYPDGF
jgi:FlaA1/EpsC-like NDP-sugar epimerase/dTDP-4-amino-4,6-dideoxygalactose transaminase